VCQESHTEAAAEPPLRTTTTCPTITPFPPTDADGDHVPDDVTLSFTVPDCSFTRDGRTLEITGTIHITDPSTTAFGARAVFGAFQHKVTGPTSAFFLSRLNGVRQVLRSPAGFSLIDSTTADRESIEHGTAQLVKAWVVGFAAGELMVTKTGSNGTVTIHIVFTGCGVEPTVTVERSAA
jgi:hypothetical protein